MFYELYGLIKILLTYDSYYHVAKRVVKASQLAGHFGVALIEYGKQKVEVVWKPQVPKNYIEEIIKLDANHFKNNSSLI